ncbi:nuclear body protein SP140-like [Anabas testudineus]|uniref:nuclear body protein SP140-like n=1 Tax=Anabas testudineus TaxID=64144 RepID=UPI000E463F7C|nr:nuclear body protein SP140-like [Anabas testudineus]
MDPLDFLESEELLRFFRRNKTEMSCMEKPQIFLNQLRDNDLIPEDRYKMVSRLENENIKTDIYDILDQIERELSQRIHVFWRCVFKEIIMDQYPTLQRLHKDLTDGSQLPETVEKERRKRKELSDIEAEEENSGKKKKKKQRSRRNSDEERPGSSSQLSPAHFLNKGEKKDVWMSSQLPVTCGDLEGTLYKDRLDKGEKCILFQQWFTPHEFKKFSKKISFKSWKLSIRCKGTPLGELIQDGHLKPVKYKRGREKAKKFLFPSDQTNTVPDKEEDGGGSEDQEDQVLSNNKESSTDDTDQEEKAQEFVREASLERYIAMKTSEKEQTDEHKHKELSKDEDKEEKQRSNNDEKQPGPSSLLTPEETETQTEQKQEYGHDCVIFDEFVKEASCQTDVFLKMKIKQEGEPVSVLKEKTIIKTSEKEQTEEHKHKELPKDEDKEEKQRSNNDEKQPSPSSLLTPASTRKKGEKNNFWDLIKFQSKLPVTCGNLKGTLDKDKLSKGKKCILFQKQWFTPGEFEKRAGKGSTKNWKLSIQCRGFSLLKLIQKGHLKPGKYRRGCKKAKKSLSSSDSIQSFIGEEEETEEQMKQQQEGHDQSKKVFKVTCGALAGTLHKSRFASGVYGKSIRTETSWMSPVEFVKKALSRTDASWKKDIKWEGKPLSVLIEKNILRIHSLLCYCRMCKQDEELLEDQKNDDECCVCKGDDGSDLVVCNHCPRSFHQTCHLPHVEDKILGDDKPWMCTFCIFRTTQQWRYSEELETRAAMSQQISRHMLECHYLLLYLYSVDEEQTFASDPILYVKNYSAVIQTPMWFDKIADKLQKKEYQTVGEFVSDVQLIFSNCATYNRKNPEFLTSGSRLKELFDGELKTVFNISEQTVD